MEKHNVNKNINLLETTVKKVNKRKPPIVKQTLTSLYRIAKANPLLLESDSKAENNFGLNKIKLPKSVLLPIFNQTNSENNISERKILTRSTTSRSHFENVTYKKKPPVQISSSTKSSLGTKRPAKIDTKDLPQLKRIKLTDVKTVKEIKKVEKPIKRISLTTKYFERKRGLKKSNLQKGN